jgi:serine protease Do
MHKHVPTGAPSTQKPWMIRLLLMMAMFCLILPGMAVGSLTGYASGPGGNVSDPLVRAVDIAEPAVVRIFTVVNSTLTVHFSSTSNVTFPQQSNAAYQLEFSGTGTFISAHGDILTADHVINPPQDDMTSFLDQTAAPDVASYINQNLKPSQPVTADQVAQELQSGQLASTPQYNTPASQVFLSTSFTGPLTAPDLNSVPAQYQARVDKIEQESAVNQQDVAIVHVSNMDDMPSVQLGDSSNVQQQDTLTIIGFPGNGDVSNAPDDLLTSSVNQILVSSIKTTSTGAPVIQVGGNVEHGDSGGPALDSSGTVVGIVSFALATDSPGGTSFLQASNSARTLVQAQHLDTTPGPLERAWTQAFNDYASTQAGHWHKAASEFAAIAASYPIFKGITPYLNYARTQAQHESVQPTGTPTPSTTPATQGNSLTAYAVMIGAIALLVLLVVLLFAVIFRKGRGKKAVPATKVSQVPPAALPPQGQRAPASLPPATADQLSDGMSAFGAPTRVPPAQAGQSVPLSGTSGSLRPWPCGHLNRSNARFCSVCGEPAPPAQPQPPTIRRYEQ